MKLLHQSYKRLSDSLKTDYRQLCIILTLLVIAVLSYRWVTFIKPAGTSWQETNIQLPNSEELQLYIDKKIAKESDIESHTTDHLDDIIDNQAMQIKLSGLTKNITIDREPTNKELNEFHQQHKEQYRQESTFHFTQYLFPTIKFGAQAINMANKTLNTTPEKRPQPMAKVRLTSQDLERQYGQGFNQKLVALVLKHPQQLPCWTQPVTSKVGAHLLCFKQANIGAIPELDAIRPQLVNHWRYEMSKKQ